MLRGQMFDEEEKRKKRRRESDAVAFGWDGNGSFVPYSAPVTVPDASGYSGGGGSFGGGGASADYGSCDSGSGGGGD